jgi:hypothetical protein
MFVIFPIIGIITGEPLFSGYALFEICSWKGSKTVIDGKLEGSCVVACAMVGFKEEVLFDMSLRLFDPPAIVINFAKMAQALLLGLLFMYVWMVLGMMLLREEHNDDQCSNMFQCFFAYVFLTIRDNGVREVLTAPRFAPHPLLAVGSAIVAEFFSCPPPAKTSSFRTILQTLCGAR